MIISRYEALKAVDDIFNYCEEIDNSLPENERSGYKMLPDIHKIRKYIIENTRPHGEWISNNLGEHWCSECHVGAEEIEYGAYELLSDFCPHCGADMTKRGFRAKMGLIDDAPDAKPDLEYIKIGDTIYTQDDDKQGWTGREENK